MVPFQGGWKSISKQNQKLWLQLEKPMVQIISCFEMQCHLDQKKKVVPNSVSCRLSARMASVHAMYTEKHSLLLEVDMF